MSEKTCPSCGMTIESVRKNGTIGCALCLGEFRSEIVMQFRRNGHGFKYSGKVPLSAAVPESDLLEKELAVALENDDFERAAVLRDLIGAPRRDISP